MGGQGRAANAELLEGRLRCSRARRSLQAGSPYRFIAESAMEAARKHDGLIGKVDLNTWVAQSIERAVGTVHSRTQEGLAVLATVGSTAPFVGLFGTVWGIYNALVRIGASGQASIDKVAGPVGEALIMTAHRPGRRGAGGAGLQLASAAQRGGDGQVRAFGSDLHTVLLATGLPAAPRRPELRHPRGAAQHTK